MQYRSMKGKSQVISLGRSLLLVELGEFDSLDDLLNT